MRRLCRRGGCRGRRAVAEVPAEQRACTAGVGGRKAHAAAAGGRRSRHRHGRWQAGRHDRPGEAAAGGQVAGVARCHRAGVAACSGGGAGHTAGAGVDCQAWRQACGAVGQRVVVRVGGQHGQRGRRADGGRLRCDGVHGRRAVHHHRAAEHLHFGQREIRPPVQLHTHVAALAAAGNADGRGDDRPSAHLALQHRRVGQQLVHRAA